MLKALKLEAARLSGDGVATLETEARSRREAFLISWRVIFNPTVVEAALETRPLMKFLLHLPPFKSMCWM